MASSFKRAGAIAGAGTRTAAYTAPANVLSSIIFDGQISNLDSTNKVSHFVTVEIYTGAVYNTIFKDVEIPYGLASPIPKQVMAANEVLYITSTDGTAAVLELGCQVVERT